MNRFMASSSLLFSRGTPVFPADPKLTPQWRRNATEG